MELASVASSLDASYPRWKVAQLISRRFTPAAFHALLDDVVGRSPVLTAREVGRSFEGRPIRLVTVGSGPITVLLWSQMHGDESTATMAIADILRYLHLHSNEEVGTTILSSLSLLFLPMLNPDGAERFQRRTAQHLDMNRDALALKTPEARILTQVHLESKPVFGFNLHDQELSTVENTKELSAISLLAPAYDNAKTDNGIRRRAKHLAATFAFAVEPLAPGKITRYDDTFEPRAFGDAMQSRGTSTVLVESGHTLADPEKHVVRRLNAIGILVSLFAIGTGEYEHADSSIYESLPASGKRAYDVIVRNVSIMHTNGASTQADLGISYQVDTHTEETPMLVDVGDLHTFLGLREVDANGSTIRDHLLAFGRPFPWERYFSLQ
jgi:hypothetical protein